MTIEPRASFMVAAFAPLVATACSVLLVAALGLTRNSFYGTALEDRFYGFFLTNYPLFLFAVVYAVARIVTAAVADPGGRRGLRAISMPVALAVVLLASVYPTFGGIILRPGFMTGGMAFVRGQSALVSSVLGAGAGALIYGTVLAFGVLLARLRIGFRWGSLGSVVLRFLALWLGAMVLLAPDRLGLDLLGVWPARPLSGLFALKAVTVVTLAFLPHALVVAWANRGSRS